MGKIGFALAHTDSQKAHAVRRLGVLPFGLPLGNCDIGEALISMGGRSFITWGRNIPPDRQQWWIDHTRFHPVWCGADDGSCELMLCSSEGTDSLAEWLRAGLHLGENPKWVYVPELGCLPREMLAGSQ
jgi:hypothetical protein